MDEDVIPPPQADPNDLSAYQLDEYDNEPADAGTQVRLRAPSSFPDEAEALGPFSSIKGLTYYRNNEEDPYITLKEVGGRPLQCMLHLDNLPARTKKTGRSWKCSLRTTSS